MDEGVENIGCWCDDGSCVVVRGWCGVRLTERVAVLGVCVAMLVRRVLRAAMHDWCEMSAAELRGADGAFLAYQGFVVRLACMWFSILPMYVPSDLDHPTCRRCEGIVGRP